MKTINNALSKKPTLPIHGVSNRLFSVNTVLHTKDGRIIGNAIIIGHEDKFNVIKTDYGHTVRFTNEEITECFHIAYSDLTEEEKAIHERNNWRP